MASTDRWYSLKLLDRVDLTADVDAEKAQIEAALPGLQDELSRAHTEVERSLAPIPATHPADDTWDDSIWFARAILETGYEPKRKALEAAKTRLAELRASIDPGRTIAGYVLDDAVGHLKEIGLHTIASRAASGPPSIGGLPLAEVVWQARNQHHHFNDLKPLDPPTFDALRTLVANQPGLFGPSAPPPNDDQLMKLLKSRSWAPEILAALGWVSATNVETSVSMIVP